MNLPMRERLNPDALNAGRVAPRGHARQAITRAPAGLAVRGRAPLVAIGLFVATLFTALPTWAGWCPISPGCGTGYATMEEACAASWNATVDEIELRRDPEPGPLCGPHPSWLFCIEGHHDAEVNGYFDCDRRQFQNEVSPSTKRNFRDGCPDEMRLNAQGQCERTSFSPLKQPRGEQCTLWPGNPIGLANGNKFQAETDYRGEGPFPLQFTRYYNSDGTVGLRSIGQHWRHHYDRTLTVLPLGSGDEFVRTRHADGQSLVFLSDNGGDTWSAEPDVVQRLRVVTDGQGARTGWRYTQRDDSVEHYDADGRLLRITHREGWTQTLSYDTLGQLETVTGPFGRTLSFTYDAQGRLETMTDPAGDVYRYTYANNNNLIAVHFPDETPGDDTDNPTKRYVYDDAIRPHALTGIEDELGVRFATYAYDEAGRAILSEHAGGAERISVAYHADGTVTVTDALNHQSHYTLAVAYGVMRPVAIDTPCAGGCGASHAAYGYDSHGYLSSRTDFNGNTTTYVHDARGLETSRTEAAGTADARTVTTEWHPDYRVPTRIVEPGRSTVYTYDAHGRELTMTVTDTASGDSRTTTRTYTNEGLLASVDGPRTGVADITTFGYDADGNLTQHTNAVGHTVTMPDYDAHGRLLRAVDANGLETVLNYDARGRLLSRSVGGRLTTLTYDAASQVVAMTLPDGATLGYDYDAAQRLIGIEDALGQRMEYGLDGAGNRVSETQKDAAGAVTVTRTRAYDSLSRLIETVGGEQQTEQLEYDTQGNLTATVDANAARTTYGYDALNRRVSAQDAAGGVTSYAYDARDNLIAVTDARGLVTTYTVTGFDEVSALESPDTGTTQTSHDGAGNVVTRTDARGVTVMMTYDAHNRVTVIDYPDDNKDVSYTYDAGVNGVGRLTSVSDESGTTAYAYDLHGNVVRMTRVIDGETYVTDYAYDTLDRVVTTTYPSGLVSETERDALGRVTRVTATRDGVTETLASGLSYRPFGPVSGLTFGNGLSMSRTFDADDRLIAQQVPGVQALAFGLDAVGNLTAIDDGLAPERSQTFDYDALHRLTVADGAYGLYDYTYDAVGNRVTRARDGALEHYTYAPDSHRLMTVTGAGETQTFAYDAAGNTTDNTAFTFVYDDMNRLAEVREGATVVGTYRYGADGARAVKDDGLATTVFHYDLNGQLIAETDALGQPLREVVYVDGMRLSLIEHDVTVGPGTPVVLDTEDPGVSVVGDWGTSSSVAGFLGAHYRFHAPDAGQEGSVTVDNADAGFSVTGSWPTSSSVSGHIGSHYQYHAPNGVPPGGVVFDNIDNGNHDTAQVSATGTWASSTSSPGFEGANYQYHAPNGDPVGVDTVDNTDPHTTAQGTWNTSTSAPGYLGGNYAYRAPGSGANTFSWTLAVAESGDYHVYARWTAHPNRASNAPYTVTHTAGSDTVTVNQQQNGGAWQGLGTYTFDAGTTTVTLSDAANGYVIADGVQLVPVDAQPNRFTWGPFLDLGLQSGRFKVYARWTAHPNRASNATYTVRDAFGVDTAVTVNQQQNGGVWTPLGTFDLDALGSRVSLTDQANGVVIADAVMLVPEGTGPNTATWAVSLDAQGAYTVYARWTGHPNRATDATYTIAHAGGTAAVSVDQQHGGGEWQPLGVFTFEAGTATVSLTDQANGYVIADAVRFVPLNAEPNAVTWQPSLPAAGDYAVYARWTAHPNRASDATYTVTHANGTSAVTVNQRENGGTWQPLGTFALDPSTAAVTLTDLANGYVIADAVQFIPQNVPGSGAPLTYYLHTDHLDTPQAITDEDGSVAWEAEYAPFGEASVVTQAVDNPLRFPGQYLDDESGFHYNFHRYYDPSTGRYLRSDPIGLEGGLNTYTYVSNNPLRFIDPLGLAEYGGIGEIVRHLNWVAGLYGDNFWTSYDFAPERRMLERIRLGLDTPYDVAWWHHELWEARMCEDFRNLPVEEAKIRQEEIHRYLEHTQGNTTRERYHPEVIRKSPDLFPPSWTR